MKTRFDFVSNSSSSSFIISSEHDDVDKLLFAFREIFLGKEDVFVDDFDLTDLSIYIQCRGEENMQSICSAFNGTSEWETDGVFNISCTLSDFITTVCSPKFDIYCLDKNKILTLRFLTYDEIYQSKAQVALLYDLCEAIGCKPDASESEREFKTDGFCNLLLRYIVNKNNAKK